MEQRIEERNEDRGQQHRQHQGNRKTHKNGKKQQCPTDGVDLILGFSLADEAPAGMSLHGLVRKAIALAQEDVDDLRAIRSLGEGWVGEEALAIALYCVLKHRDDFSACIRAAVNHDGDSDSTGAIAGSLLGAWLGADGIDEAWLAPLEGREVIEIISQQLCEVAKEQGL